MPNTTFRGKAQINSGFGSVAFDVIIYAEPQSLKLSQKWDDSLIKDRSGQNCSRRAQNEMYEGDWGFKLLGDTRVNAAKINTVAPNDFLPKLSNVVITLAEIAVANGTWTVESGCDLSLKNDDVVDFTLKLSRYPDATQNALMISIPA